MPIDKDLRPQPIGIADATRRLVSVAILAIATLIRFGGEATAQASSGSFAGQPLPTSLAVPGGATYNQFGQQTIVTQAGPDCFAPLVSEVSSGPCSPAEVAAGDQTMISNIDFFNTRTPVFSLPAPAVAPGSSVVTVQAFGAYADSTSPTGLSVINAYIPLSAFASSTAVSNETTRAITAEASLGTSMSSETVRATTAETAETSRAFAAENALGTDISNEATRAETTEGKLASAIQDEAAARIADIARVGRGYRMGVATAVALSGMGVLPGKRLNLTMNVGTYEGEWAVAAQGAYIVNEHAMLNAGISTSASGSGTGARAGVTLGW